MDQKTLNDIIVRATKYIEAQKMELEKAKQRHDEDKKVIAGLEGEIAKLRKTAGYHPKDS